MRNRQLAVGQNFMHNRQLAVGQNFMYNRQLAVGQNFMHNRQLAVGQNVMHNRQFPLKSRGFLMIKEKEANALEMWHDAYTSYLVCF